MAFEVAARDGDIEFMKTALGNRAASSSQQSLILRTIAKHVGPKAKTVPESLLGLAHSTLKSLQTKGKTITSKQNLVLVSQLICSLDEDDVTGDMLNLALLLHYGLNGPPTPKIGKGKPVENQDQKTTKSIGTKTKASPLLSLTVPARARIFPKLGEWEFESNEKIQKTSIVWELFVSLLLFDEASGAISDSTRIFMRAQSSSLFHLLALDMANDFLENPKSFQGVLEECWPVVFGRPASELEAEENLLLFRNYVRRVFQFEDETVRVRLFSEILDRKHTDTSDLPTLPNENVARIMKTTVRWLRENSETMARLKGSLWVPATAMELVTSVKECTASYAFENNGPTDNGAKEALQAIMKEMVALKLFEDDVRMVDVALVYYRELGIAAQASSTIRSNELFFRSFAQTSLDMMKRKDGYSILDEFQNILLGKSPEAEKSKLGLNDAMRALTANVISGMAEDEDRSIAPLRDIIREMAVMVDSRDGSDYEETFIKDYQELFLERTQGLFSDFDFSLQLCQAYQERLALNDVFDAAKQLSGFKDEDAKTRLPDLRKPLLDDDFARRLIERLGSRRDIRYTDEAADKIKEPQEKRLEIFVMFLFHIYDLAIFFENHEKMSEDYEEACAYNAFFVVDRETNGVGTREVVLSKKNLSKKMAKVDEAFKPMQQILVQISESAKKWKSPLYVSDETMLDRLDTIKPLVHQAFFFYTDSTASSTNDRIRSEWLTNEAILPEIRGWLEEDLDKWESQQE
ncbi:MAG: hypothetical protein SGARI_000039 [Bacillariaceae sp.]